MAEMNLAFGVGIAVGVFVVLCGVARLWWSRRTARWPRVIGEVRSTTVVKPAGTGQYGSRGTRSTWATPTSWRASGTSAM